MIWTFRNILLVVKYVLILFVIAALPVWALSHKNGVLPQYENQKYLYWLFYNLPYVLLFLIAALGLKLSQTRIFFIAGLFGISYIFVTMMPFPALLQIPRRSVALIIATTVPLSVALILSFGEGQLFGLKGLLRLLACIIPPAFLVFSVNMGFVFVEKLLLYRMFPQQAWYLPAISLLFTIGSIAVVLTSKDYSLFHFNLATILCFIPLFYSMNRIADSNLSVIDMYICLAVSYSAISFVFLYALYRIYWQEAYVDELTNVLNRRALNKRLRTLGRKYSIAMIDIDHFKNFNDTYGHAEGDNVLRFIATNFSSEAESRVFRYGGEEFTIVFPGIDAKDVFARVEKIRKRVAESVFFIRSPEKIRSKTSRRQRGERTVHRESVKVTISIGVASRTWEHKTPEDVIRESDRSLYEAKENGRNRVVVAGGGGVISV